MTANDTSRRAEFVELIAAIVLEDGFDALALRPLAARLGTSGRMLIYHFGSKDALVRDVLARLAARMRVRQDAAVGAPPETPGRFLADLLQAGIEPDTAPFMRVWTDVIARAARGEAPYKEFAERTVGEWRDWVASRLRFSPDRQAEAVALLAITEGVTLLEMARPGTADEARRWLPEWLDRRAR